MLPISILLADNDEIIRQCLRRVIETDPELRVLWEADNGLQALHLAQEHHPAVIVMDAHMARMDGIEVTRCLRQRCNSQRIILMSVYETVRSDALDAGANDFVNKDGGCDAIREAIHRIFQRCALTPATRQESDETYHDYHCIPG